MAENNEIKDKGTHLNQEKGIILIVDDEASICSVLTEFLSMQGFGVRAASSAAGGLEILDRIRVDLVVTNIRMPGMNGLGLTRLIKERYDCDVIIMSGYHSYTLEEARRLGAADLFHKPVKLEDLLISIATILSKKKI
jgi:two-component system cell cycle response regulator